MALARLIAPWLQSFIVDASKELQWIVPSVLVTGALALLSALVTWLLAREAVDNEAKAVLSALLGVVVLGALLTLALPWVLNLLARDLFDNPIFALSALLGLLIGYLGGALVSIFHLIFGVLLKDVPRNYYGIVSGHDPKSDEQKDDQGRPKNPTNYCDWLSVQLDEIAGLRDRDSPLTFGDLCEQGITLKMLSTNVSVGLPFELPFTKNVLIFNELDMRKLFPDYIVDHMMRTSCKVGSSCPGEPFIPTEKLPQGYYYVPQAADFPVAVAMRMSLAVPIFLSAVPFYSISVAAYDRARKGGEDLMPYRGKEKGKSQRNDLLLNYFSDGGTCSNLPIHFFDSWLPTRPTFGINLTAMPGDAIDEDEKTVEPSFISALLAKPEEAGANHSRDNHAPSRRVPAIELPQPGTVLNPEYRPIYNPLDFILKISDTARENHDNQQAMLPGYSERIIQVRFKEGEGGMNLAMSPDTIDAITMKGELAGKELRYAFNFEHHRWTRFLVLMSHLETELAKMHTAFNSTNLNPTYSELIDPANMIAKFTRDEEGEPPEFTMSPQMGPDENQPHQRDSDWRSESLVLTNELLGVIEAWKQRQEAMQSNGTDGITDSSSSQRDTIGRDMGKCDLTSTGPQLKHFSANCPEPKSVMRIIPQI
ncbi:MAG TPA: hypothetical protein VGE45_16015 [Chloroflexia bacterium]